MFQSLESIDLKQKTDNQCNLSIDLIQSYRPLKNHALIITLIVKIGLGKIQFL